MTKKKPNKTTKSFEFKGYANISIPESHSGAITKHVKDAQNVYEEINTLAVDGYSLKVYYNSEEGNYRASITCMNAEDSNFGYVLTSFANDWFTAIAVLTYKHFEVSKENWTDYTQTQTKGWG